jgi:hypothetical protein
MDKPAIMTAMQAAQKTGIPHFLPVAQTLGIFCYTTKIPACILLTSTSG